MGLSVLFSNTYTVNLINSSFRSEAIETKYYYVVQTRIINLNAFKKSCQTRNVRNAREKEDREERKEGRAAPIQPPFHQLRTGYSTVCERERERERERE